MTISFLWSLSIVKLWKTQILHFSVRAPKKDRNIGRRTKKSEIAMPSRILQILERCLSCFYCKTGETRDNANITSSTFVAATAGSTYFSSLVNYENTDSILFGARTEKDSDQSPDQKVRNRDAIANSPDFGAVPQLFLLQNGRNAWQCKHCLEYVCSCNSEKYVF